MTFIMAMMTRMLLIAIIIIAYIKLLKIKSKGTT